MKRMVIKTSLLFRYFATYVFILIIPLIILGTMLYKDSIATLQKEIENLNFLKVKKAMELFESQVKSINEISLFMTFNGSLRPAVMQTNDYMAYKAVEEIIKYKSYNILIDEIMLHYKGDNFVYTSRGKMSCETVSKYLFGNKNTKIENLKLPEGSSRYYKLLRIDSISSNNEKTDSTIYYYMPFPYMSKINEGSILIKLRSEQLKNFISDISEGDEGCLFIFDEKMNMLFSSGNPDFITAEAVTEVYLHRNSGKINQYNHNGRKMMIIGLTSNQSGLSFITAVSSENYLKNIQGIKYGILLTISLVTIAGLLISLFFALTNYRPVKRLKKTIGFFSEKGRTACLNNDRGEKYGNELDDINTSIKRTIELNTRLTSQLKDQKPYIQEQIFHKMLKGKLKDAGEIKELLELYDIGFKNAYYIVLVASMNNAGTNDLSIWQIDETINEVLGEKYENIRLFCIELVSGELVLIVNTDLSGCQKSNFTQYVKDVYNIFAGNIKCRLSMGVGGTCSSICSIHHSFIEALAALNYKIINGYEDILFFADLSKEEDKVFWYPVKQQAMLEQYIKQIDLDSFKITLDEIIKNIRQKCLTMGMTRVIYFGIINTIIGLINELDMRELSHKMEDLAQFRSVDELKEKLTDIAGDIVRYIIKKKESGNNKLKQSVIEYINNDFCDGMLSLDKVARYFNISEKYLSRFFKQQTGYNFSDYIKELRIEKAKKYLAETDMVIRDIMTAVGYNDLANFTRTFRLIESIPPGEYRKIHRNAVNDVAGSDCR